MAVVAMAALPATVVGRAEPRSATPDPVVSNGPKAWALATTAHLTYHNGWWIDRLAPQSRADSAVADTREILRDWWGIESRSDLLKVLDWLQREGHRVEFQKRIQSLVSMTDAEFRAYCARQPAEAARLMKLFREHYRKRGTHSLVGWDLCRYIVLCRCGYQVGFLNEDEAWGRIMPVARSIQAAFPSWPALGEDYLVGREFWSSAETKKSGQYYRQLETWLLTQPQSPWNQLAWRMDLGAGPITY